MTDPTWLDKAVELAGASFQSLLLLNPIAVAFALLTPLLLIYGRHEVRLRRLMAIRDFITSYPKQAKTPEDGYQTTDDTPARDTAISRPAAGGTAAQPDPSVVQIPDPHQGAGDEPPGEPEPGPQAPPVATETNRPTAKAETRDEKSVGNPSLEFVKSKYISDIQPSMLESDRQFDSLEETEKIDLIIKSVGTFGSSADKRIFFSTIGLIILCYYGFHTFQQTLMCGFGIGGDTCKLGVATGSGTYEQLIIIGSLAFVGAYIAAVRIFLRGLAVFDLSSYTFIRQTAEILASVALTMLTFKAFPDPFHQIGSALGLTSTAELTSEIPWIWFTLAPVLGLLPQSSTKFLLLKLQTLVQWVKTSEDRFNEVTKIVSLDIIDGIDFETRFRLEECGIYDVQNLASYNPIMLHIESPFGIYTVIDWIAQAQLCHILGPEKFLIFRELNIRTIFDLERAISDEKSPTVFDEMCISILFAPTAALRRTLEISKTKFVTVTSDKGAQDVSIDEYHRWLRERIDADGTAGATEHVMRWIGDDLHVKRLRRLWRDISENLGPAAERLETSKA